MNDLTIGSDEWLNQVKEEIVEPDIRIIDPHHHLWDFPTSTYLVKELQADTSSGHKVEKTIYMECGVGYYEEGPEHLRSVGETESVSSHAEESKVTGGSPIAGIVSRADLRTGDLLDEVLDAHLEVSNGLFRGIRHAGASAEYPDELLIPGAAPRDLFQDENFINGVKLLGRRGFTYDTWHYHYQNKDFIDLVSKVSDTQIILDHFGTPLGVGPYASQKEEIYQEWKKDMKELSMLDNVVMKIGGLAMPDNGFGWDKRSKPATSDEFVEAQRRYYLHVIDCFGPERCMMESNFPVDRRSISYHVLYNGLKKIVSDFSEDEKDQMFYRTAETIYKPV